MDGAVLGRLAVFLADGKNQAGDEVAVNVRPPQRRNRLAAIDVAAGDAHTVAVPGKLALLLHAGVVRVLDHRVDPVSLGRAVLLELVKRLADVPAVVAAARNEVDLLPLVLPDVRRPEVAGLAVETHAPDVAQAVRPNLPARVVLAPGERVVRRDAVRQLAGAGIDVDAENLAQQRAQVLRVVMRVVGLAAVARGDVKLAVRPEQNHAAVVVPIRLRELEQDALRLHVGPVRVRLGHGELADDTALGLLLRVVNVKLSVGRKLGMERHSQQPLLVFAPRLALADVKKHFALGLGRVFVLRQNDDGPALLEAEQPPGTVRSRLKPKRTSRFEPLPNRLQPYLGQFRPCGGQSDHQQ